MGRNISISTGEYYHIYNRGTDKRNIFKNKSDYDRFMMLLYICNADKPVSINDMLKRGGESNDIFSFDRESTLVSIGAYVLMPNHFHILLKEVNDNGISSFMKKLGTGYSMYFNKRYDRTGGLFEGNYKAKHAHSDEYLKYLYSYIHLNPVKLIDSAWKDNGIKDRESAEKYLNEYKYSSYLDYKNIQRIESGILDKDVFPDYFKDKNSFEQTIDYWLNFCPEDGPRDS